MMRLLNVSGIKLFTKQSPDSSQHAVLLRVVWMVLRWNLEKRRECGGIGIDSLPYLIGDLFEAVSVWHNARVVLSGSTYVLIYEENSDVLPLLGVRVKCLLDC